MFNVLSTAHCQLRTMLTQRHIVDTDTQWVGGGGGGCYTLSMMVLQLLNEKVHI